MEGSVTPSRVVASTENRGLILFYFSDDYGHKMNYTSLLSSKGGRNLFCNFMDTVQKQKANFYYSFAFLN